MTKVSIKGKLIALAVLPVFLPLMIPGLLKYLFYNVSLITEAIGAWFEELDVRIGEKSQKFFKWVKTV